MKKTKGAATSSKKITFGKRSEGKHKKSRKPKESQSKRYRGQGR